MFDEARERKPLEGFTDRRAGYLVLLGQGRLVQPGAGREAPRQDLLFQERRDAVRATASIGRIRVMRIRCHGFRIQDG